MYNSKKYKLEYKGQGSFNILEKFIKNTNRKEKLKINVLYKVINLYNDIKVLNPITKKIERKNKIRKIIHKAFMDINTSMLCNFYNEK